MRIVFFGTPAVAAKVLDYLLRNRVDVAAVVSKPDRPKGRSATPVPTPVKETVLAFNPNIPIYQPEFVSDPAFAEILKAHEADLFVVVAYGEMMKEHLLQVPRRGCINLHYSLLPKYRGAAPMQHSIIQGESETGVTVIHMVKKMDAGDIIERVKVPIGPEMTFGELENILNETGKKALLKVIHAFEKGEPSRTPQDPAQATLAPKIELEDCEIIWSRPAQELHNLVRGVNPYTGAWCSVEVKGEKKRLKISRSKVVPAERAVPGTQLPAKGNVLIATGDQALELLEVQLEGKKSMTSAELIRGTVLHFR